MNLTYYPEKPICFAENKLTLLETNNRKFYCDLLLSLQDLDSGIIYSDDQFSLLEPKRAVCWLEDVFVNNDLNRLFQSQMQKRLSNELDSSERNTLLELDRQLKSQVFDASFRFDLPLKIDNQCDFTKLIKYCGVSFTEQIKRDPYAIISSVIKTAAELNEKRTLVLKDAQHYLSVSQLTELVRLVNTLEITVLLISFSEIDCGDNYRECDYYYVDQDFETWKH